MDLNNALMESITSMSEYFVAANTRTSFTDLANDSNPLASLSSTPTSSGQSDRVQQFGATASSSSDPLGSPLGMQKHANHMNNHQAGGGGSNINQHNMHMQQQQHHDNNNHHQNHNHHQSSSSNHHSSAASTSMPNLHSMSCNQNHHHHHTHHQNQYHNSIGNYSTNLDASSPSHCGSINNNMQITSSRLSQPIRTQIPIHCYIEQLDACAEIPGYQSPLNDHDLFATSNDHHLQVNGNTRQSGTNQLHNHPQPPLLQSKLALESVTNNCNDLNNEAHSSQDNSTSNNLYNDRDVSSITSINSLQASSNNNNNNNSTRDNNTSSIDLDDLDGLDANLDHLGSTSPLTSSFNNLETNTSSRPSLINCHRPSTSLSNHHFQSCRETYAIVTSNVLYIDLVRTVLLQLGYSAMDLINAKATIQIKNWKPLALDQVTEDKRATVGEVLGDISTFVTLRIRLYSSISQLPTEWTETMIRQVVLALTQTMSQLTLSKLCNISQPLISSIVRGGKKLGRRKCAEFGQWYMNYIKTAEARPSTMFCEGGGARLVFDKTREIPQLKSWFVNNTKPNDELLEEYSKILNQHALRKDRPQVTARALKNWWKNERQKLGIRQREIRGRPKLKRVD